MGLIDFLKNLVSEFDDDSNNKYLNFSNSKKCMVKVKLSETRMIRLGFRYIWGTTSYRIIFRDVLDKDMNMFKKITDAIERKAKKGCYYDEVFIRFYSDSNLYLDIPLNVFSQKKSISKNELSKKLWHKNNLARLMAYSNVFKEEIIKTN